MAKFERDDSRGVEWLIAPLVMVFLFVVYCAIHFCMSMVMHFTCLLLMCIWTLIVRITAQRILCV